ncbi:ABC transporter integral membrane type 1 [Penicillium cf. viridicatum]|uniref:ABC transporter integral membrane type 1 n=1 Tax=Penicillium cf. viridicatum TaxID=2972119 RepID=A0A9W9MW32_9EURO|nr:ABC transporter integral membrane type 1 [Penicillium cf. viridicatum]
MHILSYSTSRMLAIIEQECVAQTVITVVHRLQHIERFDSVALLQNEALVEFDAPGALLGRESEFRKLYTASQMWFSSGINNA